MSKLFSWQDISTMIYSQRGPQSNGIKQPWTETASQTKRSLFSVCGTFVKGTQRWPNSSLISSSLSLRIRAEITVGHGPDRPLVGHGLSGSTLCRGMGRTKQCSREEFNSSWWENMMSEDQVHSESPKNRGQSPKLRNEHSWVQWRTPTIAVLARWRQENQKFKANLGFEPVLSPV